VGDTVNADATDPCEEPGKEAGLKPHEIRTCGACGAKFSATNENEFCPVCMLRNVLAGGLDSGESSFDDTIKPKREDAAQRFEHYELVKSEDGTPVELGRGAMGVTYKALDVELCRTVALKVISEKHLGDKSARLRFLREARSAASVRHPNVASVFHLGKTGSSYFYAMEFVEGETLGNFIKRSGRLEVGVALEIVTQVIAGLAAVQKEKLVHRDIKPSNIMVSFEEGGAVSAKIIDLGLAKSLDEWGTQTAISTPGGFAGTPEFASPEQFSGLPVDIRSDLYSLGATLWEMVTGRPPFRGSPGELMHRHQHASLPLEQLEDVPQPLVVLLEILLQKDPAQRPQSPAELLKAMALIRGAIDVGRRIARQSLMRALPSDSAALTRRAPARLGPRKISVASLDCPLPGAVFLVERRILLSSMLHGQTSTSMWFQSLPGVGSGSPHWSTIGSGRWLLNTIVPRSSFLAGPFTDKVPAEILHRQTNLLTLLSPGSGIQIRESERLGRRG
jgi:serine/threonine protein kinase